jgi:hypothetical protein
LTNNNAVIEDENDVSSHRQQFRVFINDKRFEFEAANLLIWLTYPPKIQRAGINAFECLRLLIVLQVVTKLR